MRYIATMIPEDGRITVLFPDLPGCGTVADTFDSAYTLAAEALSGHVESLREIGGIVPKPRDLSAIRDREEIAPDATLAWIPLIEDHGTARKVNLSLDPGLLAAIDAEAAARGVTRSALIATAARRELLET